MPHCIVEYAQALTRHTEPAQILQMVFQGALETELFDEYDIKTRAVPYTHYHQGIDIYDFIHVTMRILSGRTDDQKKTLSQSVLEKLKTLELEHTSLTVEIVDIDRDTYAKQVN